MRAEERGEQRDKSSKLNGRKRGGRSDQKGIYERHEELSKMANVHRGCCAYRK